MKRIIISLLIAVTLIATSAPAFASDREISVTFDVLLVRPLSLATTVFGTAVFIVALPFALTSRSVGATADTLVATPFKYTFTRPIGDFSEQAEPDNAPCRNK